MEENLSSKPNVVVCMVDQLRAFEVGCYGNSHIRTPNIDRLAERGVRFQTAITNNPVCTPARSCLLSGQYSRSCTGELGNVSDDPSCPIRRRLLNPTIAEHFRENGYRTALIGKWHVDPNPLLVGFEYALYPLNVHRNYGQTFIENDDWLPPVEQFAPEYEIDRVEHYIQNHAADPFFLFYNISPPHGPIGPTEMPEKYTAMYDTESLPLRRNAWIDGKPAQSDRWFKTYQLSTYWWRIAEKPPWIADPRCGYPDQIGDLPSDADAVANGFDLHNLTSLYYGAATSADDMVGRLIESLEVNGLTNNTIVVFVSDHGDSLGSHHLFNKDCLYEEAIRIPMIICFPPKFIPAVNRLQIAELIDIMPTLLDICGLPVPDHVQGRSLVPVFGDAEAELDRNYAFIETEPFVAPRPIIGIRTPTHLYGRYLSDNWQEAAEPWALFDLREDPFQECNLVETGGQADVAKRLHRRLEEWNNSTPWLNVRQTGGKE